MAVELARLRARIRCAFAASFRWGLVWESVLLFITNSITAEIIHMHQKKQNKYE